MAIITVVTLIIDENILSPFNTAWMELGRHMSKVTNPIVLGVIFFCLITPWALLLRIFGRDELRITSKTRNTMWDERSKEDESIIFDRQF